MNKKRVSVTEETETGRNEAFIDNQTGRKMTKDQFVKEIKKEIIQITT